jgi:hypothetical protein
MAKACKKKSNKLIASDKEQQTQIEQQQKQIIEQRRQIENLPKLLCLDHPKAALCREK